MSQAGHTSPLLVLDNLDLLLATGKYNEALMLFTRSLAMFAELDEASWTCRSPQVVNWMEEAGELCQRLAAVWRRLLSSPVDLSRLNASELVANLDLLHAILMATYEGHLDSYSRSLHGLLQGRFQPMDVLRLVLAWTPNSALDWSPFDYAHVLPDVIAAQAVATLACRVAESGEMARARDRARALLASGRVDAQRVSKFNAPGLVARAWSSMAGAASPEDVAAGAFLRSVARQTCGLPDTLQHATPTPQAHNDKPVLLVLLEPGVPARSLDALCAQLRDETGYYRVLVTLGVRAPDVLKDVCDEMFAAHASGNRLAPVWQRLAGLVEQWRPAAVLWPASATPLWRVLLDGVRLAPERLSEAAAATPEALSLPHFRLGERLRILLPPALGRSAHAVLQRVQALDKAPFQADITLVFALEGSAIDVQASRHTLLRLFRRPEIATLDHKAGLDGVARSCHAFITSGGELHAGQGVRSGPVELAGEVSALLRPAG